MIPSFNGHLTLRSYNFVQSDQTISLILFVIGWFFFRVRVQTHAQKFYDEFERWPAQEYIILYLRF